MIPRSSVSHFDPCCRTCALVGNSKILQGLGLGNIVNHHTTAFRWVLRRGQGRKLRSVLRILSVSGLLSRRSQALVHAFDTVANETLGCFIHPRKANAQGSWRQFVLLMLRLSGLAWTSDALSEEVMVWEHIRSAGRRGGHCRGRQRGSRVTPCCLTGGTYRTFSGLGLLKLLHLPIIS